MLIDHRICLEEEQRRKLDAISEILTACDPMIRRLLDDHQRLSTRWMPHEFVPWGRGRDFLETPWHSDQSPLDPEVVTAFETNLLTEDNLPYYHAQIAKIVDPGSALADWNRIWTSEEAGHSIVMRDYAHLMRIMDPVRLEQNRLQVMQIGFHRHFGDPLEVFAYTAVQELATRISHTKLGQKAGEPILLKLMSLISRDENFHYIFYRSLVKIVLEMNPDLMLPAIAKQLYSFEMPGAGLSDFDERTANSATLGIYGALEHRDLVIKPVLSHWEIDQLTGLSPEAERARERILRIPKILDRVIERQQVQVSFAPSTSR